MTDKQWEDTRLWDGKNLKPAPTTGQLARKWAERVDPRYPASALEEAARDYILTHVPALTMDKVMWKNGTHSLTGAELYNDGEPVDVVMLACQPDGYIDYATLDGKVRDEARSEFIPNGKRYRLVEDTEPDHPTTLTTLEDYEDAPWGTIVEERSTGFAFIKVGTSLWRNAASGWGLNAPSGSSDVLRWGDTDKHAE